MGRRRVYNASVAGFHRLLPDRLQKTTRKRNMAGKFYTYNADGEIENIKGIAPQFDARFPNQNQTRHCWQNFVDYHRCRNIKGDDHKPCDYFKWVYRNRCPEDWIEGWNEQIDAGTFPGDIGQPDHPNRNRHK